MATKLRGFGGNPGLADMSTPQARRLAATNIANVYDRTPEPERQAGRLWYPKVHDAVSKGVRGTSTSVAGGAGIVAAVSPNMDWDKNNIDAFGELHKLRGSDWDAIHRSAAAGTRTPEADHVLKGMGIATAPDSNLVKAHRIMSGEDVDTVLPRRTAPKTNSFAHNIADPGRAGDVTIDGRAHDIATGRMNPWTQGRGIGSAATPTGKKTRYEHFEDAYRNAGAAVGELPHTMQAITWTGGKAMERAGTTKSGQPRKVGVRRVGQPYV